MSLQSTSRDSWCSLSSRREWIEGEPCRGSIDASDRKSNTLHCECAAYWLHCFSFFFSMRCWPQHLFLMALSYQPVYGSNAFAESFERHRPRDIRQTVHNEQSSCCCLMRCKNVHGCTEQRSDIMLSYACQCIMTACEGMYTYMSAGVFAGR